MLPASSQWLWPQWRHHQRVGCCVTTRQGDWSPAPWQGFNLGLNCEDDASRVLLARQHVSDSLGLPVAWLTQVHGTALVSAPLDEPRPEADAVMTDQPGIACAVLTADCLPVLMARQDGAAVAAVHAGWRGLASGILEQTAARLGSDGTALDIWIGPGICQACYQVGGEVYQSFVSSDPESVRYFQTDGEAHWRCDLAGLAAHRLAREGFPDVQASGLCTVCDNHRFYSHRHEARTGRFATLIWLKEPA